MIVVLVYPGIRVSTKILFLTGLLFRTTPNQDQESQPRQRILGLGLLGLHSMGVRLRVKSHKSLAVPTFFFLGAVCLGGGSLPSEKLLSALIMLGTLLLVWFALFKLGGTLLQVP